MTVHRPLLLCLLALVAFGCGGKVTFPERYAGGFAITDSVVGPNPPQWNWVEHFDGQVYVGKHDNLVFHWKGTEAWVATIEADGSFTVLHKDNAAGQFTDADHFALVWVVGQPGDRDFHTVYRSGIRIADASK